MTAMTTSSWSPIMYSVDDAENSWAPPFYFCLVVVVRPRGPRSRHPHPETWPPTLPGHVRTPVHGTALEGAQVLAFIMTPLLLAVVSGALDQAQSNHRTASQRYK